MIPLALLAILRELKNISALLTHGNYLAEKQDRAARVTSEQER